MIPVVSFSRQQQQQKQIRRTMAVNSCITLMMHFLVVFLSVLLTSCDAATSSSSTTSNSLWLSGVSASSSMSSSSSGSSSSSSSSSSKTASHPRSSPSVASTTGSSTSSACSSEGPFGISKSTLCDIRGGEVIEVKTLDETKDIITKATDEDKLVVIDFTATWCGPCKMIAPIYEELSEDHTNVVFLKCNVDTNEDTAKEYAVSAMPTFIFIKQGEIKERLMGANASRLQEIINDLSSST